MEYVKGLENDKKNFLIQFGIIAILTGFIYRSTFMWLYDRYVASDTYYSHGFLVPFITGYLIWLKRDEFKKIKWESSILGLIIIATSLLVHLFSLLTEVYFLSGFSLYSLIFGISLFIFGKTLTVKILFPLSFLIFMFPPPYVAINAISFPMKMFAAKSAVFVLKNFINLPVRGEGFQIFFPQSSLFVGNPCSGLRSLISMLALGSIFAYSLKAGGSRKIFLFLSAIPIAVLSNIIRVIMLSLGVFIYGNKMAKGFFHDLTGYIVFVIAFSGLWYIAKLLNTNEKN